MLVAAEEDISFYENLVWGGQDDGSDDGGDDGSGDVDELVDDSGGGGGANPGTDNGSGDGGVPDPGDPGDPSQDCYANCDTGIIDNDISAFYAAGNTLQFNTCKFLSGVGALSLSQIRSYLSSNPEVLEEVAEALACAPEAVLIMGFLLAIALIALAATC